MRVILQPGESLTAVLSAAAAATNPAALVEWMSGPARYTDSIALTDDTAVVLVSAPADKSAPVVVENVSIYNGDTAAATVTLARVKADATSHTLTVQTLQVGDVMQVGARGLRTLDSSGQAKQTGATTSVEAFAIAPDAWRVHDAYATNLPVTAGTDDLGIALGTDGTHFAALKSIDFKATTTTAYARAIVALPSSYVAGSAVTIRVRGGMLTTVSDGTCTVDLEVYSNDGDSTGSADLCDTDAQSINSLTFASKDFTITPTGLVAGQLLNIRLVVAGADTATVTAVIAAVAAVELRTSVNR